MSYNYSALFKKNSFSQSGFGLVELLVSISIMVIVMAIVFVRQGSFNSAVLLRGQAYELALAMREIQLNAVSVTSQVDSDTGLPGDFRSILGVYLDTDPTKNGFYNIFKDEDSDGFYDVGEEYGAQGILDRRFEIRSIRVGGIETSDIAVVFVRPNFDARFFDSSGEIVVTSIEVDVAVRGAVGNGTSVLRTLEITSTGQIAVK